jgi:diguanylate cyclase (GGDEF)-like protein
MVLYNNHLYRNMEISAKTDALTGLYNQRTFYEIMDHKIKEVGDQETNLHLVIMDIDKFKSFNDRFGHVLGDEVLKEIGRAIKRTIRSQDYGFRYGGEEFALLFEGLDDERVKMVTERIQVAIREITDRIPVLREAGEVITVSVGISRYPEEKDNLIHLVEFADEKMYVAKEEGGDCIVC